MKRIFAILFTLVMLFTLVACSDETDEIDGTGDKITPAGMCRLSVNDPYNDLYEPLKEYYKPGETIIVKTHLVMDATVVVELNGAKPVRVELISDENGNYLYNEHEFKMPAKDSVLNLFTKGGMMDYAYSVSVNDPDGVIINQVAGQYYAGETVYIQSETRELDTHTISFNANKVYVEYLGEIKNAKDDVLYYQWKFIMPYEDVVVDVVKTAISRFLSVSDEDRILYQGCSNFYDVGQEVPVRLTTPNAKLYFNDIELVLDLKAVKGEDENILYYEQTIVMPNRSSFLKVVEYPRIKNLTFVEKTGVYDLFDDSYNGEYEVGEKIVIKSLGDLLDAEILLKANGVKIDETSYGEWTYVMPNEDVEIVAYVINTSWGDDWHYLNVEDPYGRLDKIMDGYYHTNDIVTLKLPVGVAWELVGIDMEISVPDALAGFVEYKIEMAFIAESITIRIY